MYCKSISAVVSHFASGCTDLPLQSLVYFFLHLAEFGDDEHAHSLVEAGAHTQALLVGAPVQAGDWLRGQRGVL